MAINLFEDVIDEDAINNLSDDVATIILEMLEKAGY